MIRTSLISHGLGFLICLRGDNKVSECLTLAERPIWESPDVSGKLLTGHTAHTQVVNKLLLLSFPEVSTSLESFPQTPALTEVHIKCRRDSFLCSRSSVHTHMCLSVCDRVCPFLESGVFLSHSPCFSLGQGLSLTLKVPESAGLTDR